MWCVPVNSFAAPVQKCHLKSSRLVHVRFTRLQHFFYLKQVPVKICLCTHLLRQPFSRPTWVWVAHKSPFSHRVCMICCCPLTLYDTSSKHFCFLIRPRVFRFLPMCYTNLCFTYLLTYSPGVLISFQGNLWILLEWYLYRILELAQSK